MPAGQPTKYTKAMQAKADAYLNGDFRKAGDVVPSIVGLARFLGVTSPTLWNWKGVHKEFFNTYRSINEEQHRLLVNGGLSSETNTAITKLMLSNHGYSDKVDTTSSDGSMSPKPTVAATNLSDAALEEIMSARRMSGEDDEGT